MGKVNFLPVFVTIETSEVNLVHACQPIIDEAHIVA